MGRDCAKSIVSASLRWPCTGGHGSNSMLSKRSRTCQNPSSCTMLPRYSSKDVFFPARSRLSRYPKIYACHRPVQRSVSRHLDEKTARPVARHRYLSDQTIPPLARSSLSWPAKTSPALVFRPCICRRTIRLSGNSTPIWKARGSSALAGFSPPCPAPGMVSANRPKGFASNGGHYCFRQ